MSGFIRMHRFALLLMLLVSWPWLAFSQRDLATDDHTLRQPEPAAFHPFEGTWWARSIFDQAGEPIWASSMTGHKLVLWVGKNGSFHTKDECNILNGTFEKLNAAQVSVAPMLRTTRMLCLGEYPPRIDFLRISRFERSGGHLRFYDAVGLPVATYYDVESMQRKFNTPLND